MEVMIALGASIKVSERDEFFGKEFRSEFGRICVKTGGKFSPCKHSVTEYVVDEEHRGQGHGEFLLKGIIRMYKSDIGAQVSSEASLHLFYKNGFRPVLNLNASAAEAKKLFKDEWGSLYMVYKPAKDFT